MRGSVDSIDGWFKFVVSVIVLFTVAMVGMLLAKPLVGMYPFGPEKQVSARVERCYVDISGSGDSKKSHYMVATDKGMFEVDNSLWLWIWNADEIYGRISQGSNYTFTVKGVKCINMIFQEYPGIIKVETSQKVEAAQ